jgi:hypothetical protein
MFLSGAYQEMSNRSKHALDTILRITNVSRTLILFTMVGLSSTMYYPAMDYTLLLFLLLVLDFLGLLVLMIPNEKWLPLGYAWAGVMSIILMWSTSQFIGNTYLISDVMVVLLLSSIQLLALMKIGYDNFITASQGSEVT